MRKSPLESLLRSPAEWWASLAYLLAGLFIFFQNKLLLLPEDLSKGIASFLFAASVWRFIQGYRIFCYQRDLKRLPFYTYDL